ncbi:D-alanyl-D-alanine carboxypeptidase DacB precursor [Roseovarius albus]|uniref:D-alanyl-D-alanine carboxypeptidase DacB n=1 Tax=Roseovarius albus TaxID=1247867 RepID=A0A1X6YLE8_9RHOB|nr:D-alanyl-D-alanine carboxypeptidase/D-alanyl-D-alanine-endopeptidase [Roseovarius albus]SLN24749.1 D-alanyl-D-alanine carboxypeptidase DacB precursor [Roseovarius albus]
MARNLSRRFVLAGLLGSAGSMAMGEAPATSLRPQLRPKIRARRPKASAIEEIISSAKLGGQVSCSVVDVETGLVLEGHDAKLAQPPASVTKAVTALYALDVLGAGYRFETQLVALGPVEAGVIKGDLVLAGSGDPVLDTDALARMATNLKEAGVHAVEGDLRIWDAGIPYKAMIDPEQPIEVGYNPAVSGLNLNFNRVHFEWKRSGNGYAITMDARSGKYRPDVLSARMSLSDRKGPIYAYSDGGTYDSWSVARRALGNGGARWIPMRKPRIYSAEVFSHFARSHGIVLKMGAPLEQPPDGTVLVRERSEQLLEILRDMLKYSTNLTAEMVGMVATAKRVGHPLDLQSSAREMSLWAEEELGMEGTDLLDHSGLNPNSHLTAQGLARALAHVKEETQLVPILKKYTMRDANGAKVASHPIKVVAKTGTLYFVSSLAGYMTAPDGREMSFAIFTANEEKRSQFDLSVGTRPPGASSWNGRSKRLQQKLINRWGAVYGS